MDYLINKDCIIYSRDMCITSVRLKTFDNWPSELQQKPRDLAECGFYYLGYSDKVICFYCGLGLFNWEKTDNPWLEHAIHRPNCAYLLLNKSKMNNAMNGYFEKLKPLMVNAKKLIFLSFILIVIKAIQLSVFWFL